MSDYARLRLRQLRQLRVARLVGRVARPPRRGAFRPYARGPADPLTQAIERVDELAPLSADAQADPTHALLDAWAASLHVLSFYVERTLGNCYIETADDSAAVDALARAVGYQPVPALSATTTLAFTVDEMQGAPPEVRIPRGAKVQSEPRPGESPVVFETAEALQARPAWNALAAKRLADPALTLADRHLRIAEMQIAARPGTSWSPCAPAPAASTSPRRGSTGSIRGRRPPSSTRTS